MTNESMIEGLIERIYWLIKLRWIAVIGVILTILFIEKIIRLSIPYFYLYVTTAILGIYNLIFLLHLNQIKKRKIIDSNILINRIANVQISLDLLSLTILIHFSGGIENPFIFYFIFHMIIASILLSRKASFLQATLAVLLFVIMAAFEYLGVLPRYPLLGFAPNTLHNNLLYILGLNFAFISTIYIAVYMATSISKRLRERERNLKDANLLLEEKDRIKSEYVLRVSHDIKEHLASIQACLEPVSGGILGELNPGQKGMVQRATERTSKLLFFVKALLEITRIKLSKYIETKSFSLTKTVENAMHLVESKAMSKDIILTSSIEPGIDMIKGDEIYIEETISNLLANSVKYTPSHGKINICVKDRKDSVLIQVTDTGIGIPKHEVQNLFKEFYRATNARKIERNGTGLGLAIAKQVVERHGGKIWAESEEGKGSIFSILLPK